MRQLDFVLEISKQLANYGACHINGWHGYCCDWCSEFRNAINATEKERPARAFDVQPEAIWVLVRRKFAASTGSFQVPSLSEKDFAAHWFLRCTWPVSESRGHESHDWGVGAGD